MLQATITFDQTPEQGGIWYLWVGGFMTPPLLVDWPLNGQMGETIEACARQAASANLVIGGDYATGITISNDLNVPQTVSVDASALRHVGGEIPVEIITANQPRTGVAEMQQLQVEDSFGTGTFSVNGVKWFTTATEASDMNNRLLESGLLLAPPCPDPRFPNTPGWGVYKEGEYQTGETVRFHILFDDVGPQDLIEVAEGSLNDFFFQIIRERPGVAGNPGVRQVQRITIPANARAGDFTITYYDGPYGSGPTMYMATLSWDCQLQDVLDAFQNNNLFVSVTEGTTPNGDRYFDVEMPTFDEYPQITSDAMNLIVEVHATVTQPS